MPWTTKAESARRGPGIPKSDFWTSAKEGIDQVGCVYTAQGLEFDYVGVIDGPDLVHRPMDGGWVGHRHEVPRPHRQSWRQRRRVHRLRQEQHEGLTVPRSKRK